MTENFPGLRDKSFQIERAHRLLNVVEKNRQPTIMRFQNTGEREPETILKAPKEKEHLSEWFRTFGLTLCTSHTEPEDKVARPSKMGKETVSSPELNTEPNHRSGGRTLELLLGRRCHGQTCEARLPS